MIMSQVKLISHTMGAGELEGKGPQDVISYVARVSNPHNQENFRTAGGLLKYCIKHHHWSIFETAGMTLEINTTRGIAAQILRHRSFTFQEFSQRYAPSTLLDKEIEIPQLRRQDDKNRQNSTADLPIGLVKQYEHKIARHYDDAMWLYQQLLDNGVAKECARFVLPLGVGTRLYMTGSCRSWLHYIELRSSNGTQKEHQDLAIQCKDVFKQIFPDVAAAMEWE
jgi:thymidylate synthase (FAD)